MDLPFIPSSSLQSKSQTNPKFGSWNRRHGRTELCYRLVRIKYDSFSTLQWRQGGKTPITRETYAAGAAKKGIMQLEKGKNVKVNERKGTIAGAVALVIGTSIGSGILALPKKASLAGIIPSTLTMIICWAFLLIEALLLIEINVNLRKRAWKRKILEENEELEVISMTTMAQETLGDGGGTIATVFYVFLGYTSMIAYCSKSGEILFRLVNLPEYISGILFTTLFTVLISIGGTRATDLVNQWLTTSMIGLLVAIEVVAFWFGGWSGCDGNGNWGEVPSTVPVMIFSLVYHDLIPVLCAYLGGDLVRLRVSVLLGSSIPLLALLIWDAIALNLSFRAGDVHDIDPVELLTSLRWGGISYLVEAFSLLALGTSLIGTMLGFSEFFREQLKNSSSHSLRKHESKMPGQFNRLRNWWGRNKSGLTAMVMVVVPSLVVTTTIPDAFSAATDIAGGYCMTILYGVLPPAMAWATINQESEETDWKGISSAKPVVFGVGLFAVSIVVEQMLQNFSVLHLNP